MAESAAHVRVIEGNVCVLEGSVRLSALQHCRTPPYSKASRIMLARMDVSPSLRVAVFESANPEFYLPTLI